MNISLDAVVRILAIGIGATIVMDLWAIFLRKVFSIQSLDYRLVGRWIGHMPGGKFIHQNIAQAAPVKGEGLLGWGAHYAIGITFAALLVVLWGVEWTKAPTPFPPLFIGIVTVVAPYFIMQPGMGAGIAASKTPNPTVARIKSLVTHTVYGLGLYLSALLTAQIF